jgi:hypothetical protein
VAVPFFLLAACLTATANAATLDFGGALQDLDPGEEVGTVTLSNGATMDVHCSNDGGGPDLCIVFDSEDPSGGDVDLGTPNEDFDGPGEGAGGEDGEDGENDAALGKVLIIAEDDTDDDDDGLVDEPDDESGGGTLWLQFSHAGRLSFSIIDVDDDEAAPQVKLYKDGALVDEVEGESLGDNSVQHLDLAAYGNVDAVEIELDGSSGIAGVQLDVEVVGTESNTWSRVKTLFR